MELISSSLIEYQKSEIINPLETDPKEISDLAEEMIQFCIRYEGVGLSACQIGDFRSFFVYSPDGRGFDLVLNPVYYKDGSRYYGYEVCLSYPDEVYLVKRFRHIRVEYMTINKEKNSFEAVVGKMSHYPALIFQHETDHSNGITIRTKGKKKL